MRDLVGVLRIALSELRHRWSRTLALLLGVIIATASFTVLTGTSETSRLRTTGLVSGNFRSAYDVLVRPHGSTTVLERSQGIVRANYLSGIFGGITTDQYAAVRGLRGVDVAAPIAMIGYVMPPIPVPVDLTKTLGRRERALYAASTTWTSDRGLTHVSGERGLVYVTRRPLTFNTRASGLSDPTAVETLSSGGKTGVCATTDSGRASSPFDLTHRFAQRCWSTRTGYGGGGPFAGLRDGHFGYIVDWPFPFLVAGIDPVAEARLAHVDRAVVSGRYLRASDAARGTHSGGNARAVPVLASTRPFLDESVEVVVRRLPERAAVSVPRSRDPQRAAQKLHGPVVYRRTIGEQSAYRVLLAQLTGHGDRTFFDGLDGRWTLGAPSYLQESARRVRPEPVRNPGAVWRSVFQYSGFVYAPLEGQDAAFRRLREQVSQPNGDEGGIINIPVARTVGTFDPAKLPGFSALSAVPLETYNPPVAAPANERTRRLLGGRNLLPNNNFAGYLAQPPLLLTTLRSIGAFHTDDPAGLIAPISVIRVRVAGVTGPDSVSRERVRLVAEEIRQRTGLDVDITVGSSPTPVRIDLPAGRFGRPALALREGWVKKGVAVAVLTAVDRKSVVLFVLILVVCALFVANATAAAVRSRRVELGVLSCLGWPARRLFAVVLVEIGLVGLIAGLLGSALSLPLAAAAGLHASLARAALAVPAATLLALLAGAVPAMRAAGSHPAAAVRPAVLPGRSGRRPRSVGGLAVRSLLRVPGRTFLGATSLAVGIAALTLLLAVTLAFRGAVVGSLLGDAVSVKVRGADVVAVVAIVLLGGLAVADVLYLEIRERSAEFATLRATGWGESALARLVAAEGVGLGVLGSLVGAAMGLALSAAFAGALPIALILTACAAVTVGVLVAAASTVVPVLVLRRLPTAQLLAEE